MKFLNYFIHLLTGLRDPYKPKERCLDPIIRFTCQPKELVPLTAEEQDELDVLLQKAKLPTDAISDITTLDGFLTCLVIGPKRVMPDEWLCKLFDGQRPALTDIGTTRLLTLIERHHHSITLDFVRTKPNFRPLFIGFTRAKKAKPVGKQLRPIECWCDGFMVATDLRWGNWCKLLDTDDSFSLLYSPWILGTADGEEQKMQQALDYYLDEGYGYAPEEAKLMVLRWLTLPGTHLRNVSSLKKSILHIHAYWQQGKLQRCVGLNSSTVG